MRFSATKFETASLCRRKAWLSSRTARQTNPSFQFGTALHAVAERYLSADDHGRVPKPPWSIERDLTWKDGPLVGRAAGDTVDLYPDGWDEGLTPADSALIRQLVQMGIEAGVLERRAGRKVEGKFEHLIGDDVLTGFIDLELPGEIQDHKTTKSMRWAKGSEQLRTNIQMLVYAWWYFYCHEAAMEVVLRHNTFCKGVGAEPAVRYRETTVTREYVLKWWDETIVPLIDELREDDLKEDPFDVPEARPGSGACEKYGGCERALLCTGFETFEQHKARLEMGVFDGMNEATREAAPKREDPAAPGTVEIVSAARPISPPWANADCDICDGTGFNKKGNPCKMCDADATEDHKSYNYTIVPGTEGGTSWRELEIQKQEVPTSPKAEEVVEATEPSPEPVTQDIDPEFSKPVKADGSVEQEPKGKKRGRPKQGFTLLVGATVERHAGAQVIYADQLLRELGDGLAKAAGFENYYQMNAFERRDAVASKAAEICKNFTGRTYVVASGRSPDSNAFVDAVRPFAANVIVGGL